MTSLNGKLFCSRVAPKNTKHVVSDQKLLIAMTLKLQDFVVRNKLNQSGARVKILETIISQVRHFTAQDLLARLRKSHPKIGQATFYRNLPVLVECGILQEGPTDLEGHRFYELVVEDHHDHIVCLDCKNIFEFHDKGIEKLQDIVTKKNGFTPKNHKHVIYASCKFLKN